VASNGVLDKNDSQPFPTIVPAIEYDPDEQLFRCFFHQNNQHKYLKRRLCAISELLCLSFVLVFMPDRNIAAFYGDPYGPILLAGHRGVGRSFHRPNGLRVALSFWLPAGIAVQDKMQKNCRSYLFDLFEICCFGCSGVIASIFNRGADFFQTMSRRNADRRHSMGAMESDQSGYRSIGSARWSRCIVCRGLDNSGRLSGLVCDQQTAVLQGGLPHGCNSVRIQPLQHLPP